MEINFHKVVRVEIERHSATDTHWIELIITEDGKKPVGVTLFAAESLAQLTLRERE